MASKVSKNISIGAGVIGIILLACGLACCICGFIWTKYGGGAHGIWSGLGLLGVGTLGVVVLITKSKAVMVFFLVFCIIDLIMNVIQAIIAAIVSAVIGILQNELEKGKCVDYNGQCHCSGRSVTFEFKCDDMSTMLAIFQAITAFSVIGIIVTFSGSIIGCIGACCEKGNDTPGVMVIQQGNPGQVQTVQTFQHQTYPPPPAQPGYPVAQPGYPPQNDMEMGVVNGTGQY